MARRLSALVGHVTIIAFFGCSESVAPALVQEDWFDLSLPAEEGALSYLNTRGIPDAVSDRGVVFVQHRRAATFSSVFRETAPLRAISRSVAVGDRGLVVRTRDGFTWARESSGTTQNLNSVWQTNEGEVLAVGDDGTILGDFGRGWTVERIGDQRLSSVWADARREFWITGGRSFWRGRPGAWQKVETGYDREVAAIAGLDDFWAVGEGGAILRWNGQSWERRTSPTTENLKSVAISHPVGQFDSYEVWVVGEQGTILRWNRDQQPERFHRAELGDRVTGVAADLFHPNRETIWFFGREGLLHARLRRQAMPD